MFFKTNEKGREEISAVWNREHLLQIFLRWNILAAEFLDLAFKNTSVCGLLGVFKADSYQKLVGTTLSLGRSASCSPFRVHVSVFLGQGTSIVHPFHNVDKCFLILFPGSGPAHMGVLEEGKVYIYWHLYIYMG